MAGNLAAIGLVAFIFVMLVLVINGVTGSNIVGVTFFYFLALFLLCFMFLRQSRFEVKTSPLERPVNEPHYIKPDTTAQLPEPTDRPASVTEHTTRSFEPIYRERK